MSIGVRENAEVRAQRSEQCLFSDYVAPEVTNSLFQFAKYTTFRFRPHRNVMWQSHVSEEIDALAISSNTDFFRMQFQHEVFAEKTIYWFDELCEVGAVARDDYEVVGVASVVFYLQLVLHELVEFVHVDVRKELRSQVADWHTSNLKEVSCGCETAHDLVEQPHRVGVLYLSAKQVEQDGVIHAVEELPHIALERIATARVIAALSAEHLRDFLHPFVSSLAHPAREGSRDERVLKNRVEYVENGVVEDPIAYCGLVDSTQFWIVNPKSAIRSVSVRFLLKFSMELEYMLFKVVFKHRHIRPVPLVTLEYIPCGEQVFRSDY